MNIARMALLVVLGTTCSCRNGGGSTTGSGNVAATPAPPVSTPASPSYAEASDFTRDRNSTGIGLRIVFDRTTAVQTTDIRLDQEASSFGFDFVASTKTYRARYDADTITAVTRPTTIGPLGDQFVGPDNSYFLRSPFNLGTDATNTLIGSTYAGYVFWRNFIDVGSGTRLAERYILFGSRTVASDLPTSGTSTLTGMSQINGGTIGGAGSTASIIVDYGARTITATTAFTPTSPGGTGSSTRPFPALQPITLSGTLDPVTSRISGMATHVTTGSTGYFEGALYGPRGVEAGLLFSIKAADGTIYYGAIAGRA